MRRRNGEAENRGKGAPKGRPTGQAGERVSNKLGGMGGLVGLMRNDLRVTDINCY
ncbi:hypothetical protein L6304_03905 [bacterium]|nr:hypothetical protein [bacterium]MCG2676314.1 hypothetical protein [bacterium]